MLLRIDTTSAQPLHRQIAGQLRAAIGDGDLAAGERLPPARELAASLGVNLHTVRRALTDLRDEGLLDVRRGRGTVVTGRAPRLARLGELSARLVAEARRAGLTDRDVVRLVEVELAGTAS